MSICEVTHRPVLVRYYELEHPAKLKLHCSSLLRDKLTKFFYQ